MKRIIGVDPGSEESGMVVMDDSVIVSAFNVNNTVQLYDKITNYSICRNLTIVIEDIKPYSLRLTPQVIDTCKFIGELVYRLKIHAGFDVRLLSRYDVKRWVFDTFPDVCLPAIEKKIAKKGFDACDIKTRELIRVWADGELWKPRKPSFVFVDDRIVTEAMKYKYKIPLPKAGSGYEYGLQTHSWQALAAASCFMSSAGLFPKTYQ